MRNQGCALAQPGAPWCLTFALGRLENLTFFTQTIYWVSWILQFQSSGLPSIFLRAQPWERLVSYKARDMEETTKAQPSMRILYG